MGNDHDEDPGGPVPFEIDFVGAPDETPGHSPDRAGRAQRGMPHWLAAVGGVGALALLWIVTSLTSSDPPPIVQTETGPAEVALVAPSPPPTPTPTALPAPTPQPPNFLDSRAASIARGQLASAASGMSVLYISSDGIGQLELSTGDTRTLRTEVTNLSGLGRGSILRATDGLTYAVDPSDLSLVHIAATTGLIATVGTVGDTDAAEFIAFSTAEDQVFVVQLGDVPHFSSVQVPEGASLSAVDTLGVLAYVPDVGTLTATFDGFEFLSEGEVLNASRAAWVERRCVSGEECNVVLVGRSGDEQILPQRFAGDESAYVVSPDGRMVVRATPEGFGELYLADSGDILFIVSEGMHAPTWAPDSSFIAWIDLANEPALKLMLPDTYDWITARLGVLGDVVPVDSGILVVAD